VASFVLHTLPAKHVFSGRLGSLKTIYTVGPSQGCLSQASVLGITVTQAAALSTCEQGCRQHGQRLSPCPACTPSEDGCLGREHGCYRVIQCDDELASELANP
jgi:hypothetical protein